MEYRILLIEDSPNAYRFLLDELTARPLPGITYHVQSAQAFIAEAVQGFPTCFQLVVATLRRRNSVLSVLRKLRTACPDTQLLLLRHSDASLIELISAKELRGTVVPAATPAPDLRVLLEQLMAQIISTPAAHNAAPEPRSTASAERDARQVAAVVDEIRHEAHAKLALYTNTTGHIIDQQGETRNMDIPALTSLVAGGFINAVELGRTLQDSETQHFSAHEGRHYNVYSINVGSDWLLTLVFDKHLMSPKIGVAMLIMKRGAERLNSLRSTTATEDNRSLDSLFSLSLSTEFDRVFGRELQTALVV
ncbi:MAG: hypothetical protein H7Z42_14405 [Roseiflexaceae bacterium]|nr:hypothetical protein [Roseiflexaceae bacterium]